MRGGSCLVAGYKLAAVRRELFNGMSRGVDGGWVSTADPIINTIVLY